MEKRVGSLREGKRQFLLALMVMLLVFTAMLFAAPVRAQAAKKLVVKECGYTIYQPSYDKSTYEVSMVAKVYNPNPRTTVLYPHGHFNIYTKSGKLIKQSFTNSSHVAPRDTIYMYGNYFLKKSDGVPYKVRFELEDNDARDYVTPDSKKDWKTSGFKIKNLKLTQNYSSYYYEGSFSTKYDVKGNSIAVVVVFRKNGKLAGQVFAFADIKSRHFKIFLPKEMKAKLGGAKATAYIYPRNSAAQLNRR